MFTVWVFHRVFCLFENVPKSACAYVNLSWMTACTVWIFQVTNNMNQGSSGPMISNATYMLHQSVDSEHALISSRNSPQTVNAVSHWLFPLFFYSFLVLLSGFYSLLQDVLQIPTHVTTVFNLFSLVAKKFLNCITPFLS